jgi:hypothetical protein
VLSLVGFGLGLWWSLPQVSALGQSSCGTDEFWTGTNSANTRYDDGDGLQEDNHWDFLDGNDYGRSLDCGDSDVDGGSGQDNLGGGGDNDSVWGHGGDDTMYGGEGNDSLYGGEQSDVIQDDQGGATGNSDFDYGVGEDGVDDVVDFLDGDVDDSANGGAGSSDHCLVDHTSEKTGGCEN